MRARHGVFNGLHVSAAKSASVARHMHGLVRGLLLGVEGNDHKTKPARVPRARGTGGNGLWRRERHSIPDKEEWSCASCMPCSM